jgi:hypothetical protein
VQTFALIIFEHTWTTYWKICPSGLGLQMRFEPEALHHNVVVKRANGCQKIVLRALLVADVKLQFPGPHGHLTWIISIHCPARSIGRGREAPVSWPTPSPDLNHHDSTFLWEQFNQYSRFEYYTVGIVASNSTISNRIKSTTGRMEILRVCSSSRAVFFVRKH